MKSKTRMPKLPLVSWRKMCKIVEKLGFTRDPKGSGHLEYSHPDGRRTAVPKQSKDVLYRSTIAKILNQIGLTREEYERIRLKV